MWPAQMIYWNRPCAHHVTSTDDLLLIKKQTDSAPVTWLKSQVLYSCRLDSLESLVQQEIFLPESNSSAASLTVSVKPPCAITYINICAHLKNPKNWQPYPCLDTGKYYTHWQEWVALLLWLLCLTQVRWPKSPQGTIVTVTASQQQSYSPCLISSTSIVLIIVI